MLFAFQQGNWLATGENEMLVTAAHTVSCVDTGWIADVLLHLNGIFRSRGAPYSATAEACLQKKSLEKIVNCLTLRGAKDITSAFRRWMPLRWNHDWDLVLNPGFLPQCSMEGCQQRCVNAAFNETRGDDTARLWCLSLLLKWAHLACVFFKARLWMLLWILATCCWRFHCEVLYATGQKLSNTGGVKRVSDLGPPHDRGSSF